MPYLGPKSLLSLHKYTLVLDLDETLIHFEHGNQPFEDFFLIRPGAKEFLKKLAACYEIVIFTAAMPDYADFILN